MKFKAGDKVRVRKDLKLGKLYHMADGHEGFTVVNDMMRFAGKVVTIRSDRIESQYNIVEDAGLWVWSDGMFEDVAKHEPIVIYQKDEKTVVALDKETGEKAKAVCSKDDEFDFYKGARLAFSRLKQGRKFSIGDKVIGNKEADCYGITRKGWVGEVVRYGVRDGEIVVRSTSDDDNTEYGVKEEKFDLYKEEEHPKVKPWSAVDTEDMRRELLKFCQGRGCLDCVFSSLNCRFSSMEDDELRLAYALAKQVYGDKE